MAPFVGAFRLKDCFLVAPRDAPPRLAFGSPMERDEAEATGLDLLPPRQLEEACDGEVSGAMGRARRLVSALKLCNVAPGPLALAGHLSVGEAAVVCEVLAEGGWAPVAGEALVASLRRHKGPQQIEAVRRAAAGVCRAHRRVAEVLRAASMVGGRLELGAAPLTVGRLRRAVVLELAQHGLSQPEGSIVAPAEEGAVPHNPGSEERVLRPGESLVVDLFPKGELFADCTRTFCVGQPSPALERGHRLVAEALRLAHEGARAGVVAFELEGQVADFFETEGFPTRRSEKHTERGFVHGLGHGVGFEVHEPPSFRREAEGVEGRLELGDVVTLEPGLYEPEEGWAVRLEDMVLVGDEGVENLTPLPYSLDPRDW